jgi:hypothetical protein
MGGRQGLPWLSTTHIRFALLGASAALMLFPGAAAPAQDYANPADWVAASYTDFAVEDENNAPYFNIWRNEIGLNNEAAAAKGIAIPAGYQAPLAEAHWALHSAPTIAAVTILNAGCDSKPVFSNAEIVVTLCPTRTVLWTGPIRNVRDQPKSCFLKILTLAQAPAGSSSADAKTGMFMSYDIATRSIKIGVIVDSKVLDACSHYLPLK